MGGRTTCGRLFCSVSPCGGAVTHPACCRCCPRQRSNSIYRPMISYSVRPVLLRKLLSPAFRCRTCATATPRRAICGATRTRLLSGSRLGHGGRLVWGCTTCAWLILPQRSGWECTWLTQDLLRHASNPTNGG